MKSIFKTSSPLTSSCISYDFIEMSDTDVLKGIAGKSSKSSGLDEICLKMIKLICPTIVSNITNVINTSLRDGCSSHSWTKAQANVTRTYMTSYMHQRPANSLEILQTCNIDR